MSDNQEDLKPLFTDSALPSRSQESARTSRQKIMAKLKRNKGKSDLIDFALNKLWIGAFGLIGLAQPARSKNKKVN